MDTLLMTSAEVGEETVPHLLVTCPALCQRRPKNLGTCDMDDLEELLRIKIRSLDYIIRNAEWFRN